MATLVLTAVGTAIGGPLGGALGAFIGQQADRAIFGSGSREGPRLKELSVTTSSYGQAMPRHFGRMRVGGTVIWATDLVESSSTSGGKGKPKTTTYSYSANFAVALSSTPIQRVGRIWADGTLLRGAAEDLKVDGEVRIYTGHGDAYVDPLIAADKGSQAPAFRDCAYVVFENLELSDFGNRIPALSFEIFADDDASVSLAQLVPDVSEDSESSPLDNARGFADEGGSLASTLSVIDRVYPLTCATTREGLKLSSRIEASGPATLLPEALYGDGPEDTQTRHTTRNETAAREPMALRYYDENRDYQPGVQRAIGLRPNGREAIVDLPATLTANGAKTLANGNANRARWHKESRVWRVGELDPRVQPGSLVRIPDSSGLWRVKSWEWFDRGVELGLQRVAPGAASASGADTGIPAPPEDVALSPTVLRVFEAPHEDSSRPSEPVVLVAATSSSSAWNGAALFVEQGSALTPVGSTGGQRAVTGELVAALEPSTALLFEPGSSFDIRLAAEDLILSSTDMSGLAAGANRVLIGDEVVQFHTAHSLGDGLWRLSGLLRGRAGTEGSAQGLHAAQTPVTLLDTRLTDIGSLGPTIPIGSRIAAIGRGDDDAVFAPVENQGLSRRPLSPVHPRVSKLADGSLELCWIRRARGQWTWDTEGELPLVEQSETYTVGYGPVNAPLSAFSVAEPRLVLAQADRDALVSAHGAHDLWVRQVGTYASSAALFLTSLT